MAIFNSFTFDNENSLDSGIYITGEAVFNAPKRVVEMVNVPGRNGAIAIDEGRFENIPVKYPAGCFADNMADFAEKVENFRNILASRFTYKRLMDTYYPDEFRMGLYRSGLEVDVVNQARAGKFDIEFDCKPQRFLLSGEVPTEYIVGMSPSDEQTKTGSIVAFEAEEDTIISDVKVDINPVQSLNGYDKPWAGGNGKNLIPFPYADGTSKTVNGITYTVNADGSVKAVGTATTTSQFYLAQNLNLADGDYILTGDMDTDTGSPRRTSILFNENTSSGASHWNEGVNYPCEFTVNGYVVNSLRIRVQSGATVNQTFYPMIRKADIVDDTYEPYENICPISGWDSVKVTRTGKNLLPTRVDGHSTTINGISIVYNFDGSITLNGTATATAISNLISNTASQNRLYLPQGEYNISGEDVANNKFWIGILPNAESGNWGATTKGTKTFAVNDGEYVFPRIRVGSGVTLNNVTIHPQIELGSSATVYEPYQGNTYTIDLNGTRYGGTLDVTSGVLTVDRAYMTVGSVAWEKGGTGTYSRFYTRLVPSGIKIPSSQTVFANIISDRYATAPYFNDILTHNGEIAVNITGAINITDGRYSDASSFINAMADTQIVYELATPITVQLTPTEVKTLLGTNNIWADSGDITVKYGTDPYIIINPTDFPSKPLLEVTGVGSFWLGDTQITITGTSGQIIYIDCETGECYKEAGGIISSANGLVTLNRLDFPKLASGINNIQLGSGISTVKITPRWWRL